MVLEATVICLDNSEWQRNGDYHPSRLVAQKDAITLIANAKTQSHPENTVALLSMAGDSVKVNVTLTMDLGKILAALSQIQFDSECDFLASLQVAALALKHRQNRNQRQRIIFFVGSPMTNVDERALVKLGKKLKKNNVAVDIVNFGEPSGNAEKLEAFLNAVNSNDTSHLITVPPGPHILSDVLLTSPLVRGEDGDNSMGAGGSGIGGSGGGDGGMGMDDLGFDPSMDPELAMAIRLSLQEEQQRQERERQDRERGGDGAAEGGDASAQAENADVAMDDDSAPAAAPANSAADLSLGGADAGMFGVPEEMDEETALQLALQMSMNEAGEAPTGNPGNNTQGDDEADVDAMMDDDYLDSLVGGGDDKKKEGEKKGDGESGSK